MIMPKKKKFLLIIFIIAALLVILNLQVTSKQGINYVVRDIKMPLYIKVFEFMDRDYHYKKLVAGICQGHNSDEDKALALFAWVCQNIKKDMPKGWPVVDDHVWNIIARGYGVSDQFSDVFTTLCNYAKLNAFYGFTYHKDGKKMIIFSFVKISGRWRAFDPYRGCYFKNRKGVIADIEELRSGSGWSTESMGEMPDIDYPTYFSNLPTIKDINLSRPSIQSPLHRIIFELKKRFK